MVLKPLFYKGFCTMCKEKNTFPESVTTPMQSLPLAMLYAFVFVCKKVQAGSKSFFFWRRADRWKRNKLFIQKWSPNLFLSQHLCYSTISGNENWFQTKQYLFCANSSPKEYTFWGISENGNWGTTGNNLYCFISIDSRKLIIKTKKNINVSSFDSLISGSW